MSLTTQTKRTHQSTHSNGSTYPLPSLCSSLSSHNSSSKSLPPQQPHHPINDDVDNTNGQNVGGKADDKRQRKRWDDSQFAIDLCDDNYKPHGSHDQNNNNNNNTTSAHTTTLKILKSKLFQYPNTRHYSPTHHSSSSSNSSTSHKSSHSQISVKFTSLLRKIKSMKS